MVLNEFGLTNMILIYVKNSMIRIHYLKNKSLIRNMRLGLPDPKNHEIPGVANKYG